MKTNEDNNYLSEPEETGEITDSEFDLSADTKQKEKEIKNKKVKKEDGIFISRSQLMIINSLLSNLKESNEKLMEIFSVFASPDGDEARISIGQASDDNFHKGGGEEKNHGIIIEGVFDGENMIGPDGKQYSVPANYASKSKLVEGDILKLTITANGTFVYKQIGPIERRRLIGVLEQTASGSFLASAEGKKYRLLSASVTYYKGRAGDEVVILVPKTGETKWAAVENIVKKDS